MIFWHPTLFSGMPLISMVSTEKVLISPWWVTPHLVWPSKVRLILDSIYNSVHRLLGCHIHFPHLSVWFLNPQIFPSLDWKPPCRGWLMIGALPLFCCRSSSNLLYSSIRLINCLISSRGLLVTESYNLESLDNANQKVLIVIFLLPPPILLYNSQYQLV